MKNKYEFETTSENDFTLPEIKKQGEKWFIEFYQNGKRHRYTYRLNRIKDLKKREREAAYIRNQLEKMLLDGYNPEDNNPEIDINVYTFETAFEFGYSKAIKSIRPNTLKAYGNYIKNIKESDHYNLIKDIPIKDIKRKDIAELFEAIEESNTTTTSVINKAIVVLKIVFNKLIEYDIIEHSPAVKIKTRKTEKPKIKVPTHEEIIKIKDHLDNYLPNLWGLILFIFQSGLRPNEILSIKLNMIDIDKRIINIPKEFVKTNIDRSVAIDEPMFLFLNNAGIKNKDADLYLFGLTDNRDMGLSYKKTPTGRIHYLWKLEVKDPLDIDINMYSFKHLRANKELAINNNLEQAKVLFGHTDLKTTEIYANQKNDIFIDRLKQNTLDLNNLQ